MANILYLVHRLPYPPNKGDKVRSYNLLKHLLKNHRVFLGTFVDDPEDEQHICTLSKMCPDLHVAKLDPRRAKIRSLNGLISGDPLTLRYYRDAGLQNWVDNTCRHHTINAAVIFSSAMAQYIQGQSRMPIVIDFVDVDSAKWTQYAPQHRWPMSWLYRREGRVLLDYERKMASQAVRSFFVTEAEAELFSTQAPECRIRVEAMCNGVDSEYFSPQSGTVSPYPVEELPVVFTGAMDYWPNIDAVIWFNSEILPRIRQSTPKVRFYIVGRNPTPAVLTLAGEHVTITGTVPDVRPYLQHARIVVAPLRIARGIQNKILEAMAMAQAVIASTECSAAVNAEKGVELLTADNAEDFADKVIQLLSNPEHATQIGRAARRQIVSRYSWEAHLRGIDPYLSLSEEST